jgi:hypothetical protein
MFSSLRAIAAPSAIVDENVEDAEDGPRRQRLAPDRAIRHGANQGVVVTC